MPMRQTARRGGHRCRIIDRMARMQAMRASAFARGRGKTNTQSPAKPSENRPERRRAAFKFADE